MVIEDTDEDIQINFTNSSNNKTNNVPSVHNIAGDVESNLLLHQNTLTGPYNSLASNPSSTKRNPSMPLNQSATNHNTYRHNSNPQNMHLLSAPAHLKYIHEWTNGILLRLVENCTWEVAGYDKVTNEPHYKFINPNNLIKDMVTR